MKRNFTLNIVVEQSQIPGFWKTDNFNIQHDDLAYYTHLEHVRDEDGTVTVKYAVQMNRDFTSDELEGTFSVSREGLDIQGTDLFIEDEAKTKVYIVTYHGDGKDPETKAVQAYNITHAWDVVTKEYLDDMGIENDGTIDLDDYVHEDQIIELKNLLDQSSISLESLLG